VLREELIPTQAVSRWRDAMRERDKRKNSWGAPPAAKCCTVLLRCSRMTKVFRTAEAAYGKDCLRVVDVANTGICRRQNAYGRLAVPPLVGEQKGRRRKQENLRRRQRPPAPFTRGAGDHGAPGRARRSGHVASASSGGFSAAGAGGVTGGNGASASECREAMAAAQAAAGGPAVNSSSRRLGCPEKGDVEHGRILSVRGRADSRRSARRPTAPRRSGTT